MTLKILVSYFNDNLYLVPEIEEYQLPNKPVLYHPEAENVVAHDDDNSLFIDVKISEDRRGRLVVRPNDDPVALAKDFVSRHALDEIALLDLEETLRIKMSE